VGGVSLSPRVFSVAWIHMQRAPQGFHLSEVRVQSKQLHKQMEGIPIVF